MEIIPYYVHLPALLVLAGYAVYRPRLFPLIVTVAYTAFFHITHIFESSSLINLIIIQSTLASILITGCITFGENVKYVTRFCLSMLLGILNLILMYAAKDLSGGFYTAAQVATASITYTLSIFEFYFLYRMNNDARGSRIDKVCIDWFLSGLSVFQPSKNSIKSHYWEAKSEG